jgi:hypothetical protein
MSNLCGIFGKKTGRDLPTKMFELEMASIQITYHTN